MGGGGMGVKLLLIHRSATITTYEISMFIAYFYRTAFVKICRLMIKVLRLDIYHISEPVLVEQYVVVADYVKREDTDISLKAGCEVDVIEKNEHGKGRIVTKSPFDAVLECLKRNSHKK